ncbi:hypothetical protein CPB83DRAFT_690304 [Crepidotus variabilis]|uniref:Uncharacterized protein n=1 Tax=Crepidotus variabilis TaxID=179855 RepID=A0A9P6E6A6_9AGAR|nr:hypothetical protein CPB83DRAFT_690304 [Crepidotus variabilis]
MMQFKLTIIAIALFGGSLFAAAAPIDFSAQDYLQARDDFNDEVELVARWGSGKYVVDDNTYHRSLKPAIIKAFNGHDSKFTSKCGSNPDFMVDRKGMVYPEPQKSKSSSCPKNKFTLDLGSLIQSFQAPSRSPSPARSPSPGRK